MYCAARLALEFCSICRVVKMLVCEEQVRQPRSIRQSLPHPGGEAFRSINGDKFSTDPDHKVAVALKSAAGVSLEGRGQKKRFEELERTSLYSCLGS